MAELTCTLPLPKTPQELEQAIQHYLTDNLSGQELFCLWQAIRDASLQQTLEIASDRVPGDASY